MAEMITTVNIQMFLKDNSRVRLNVSINESLRPRLRMKKECQSMPINKKALYQILETILVF